MIVEWARLLLDLVYPRSCAVCGGDVAAHPRYFCWECWCKIPLIQPPFCAVCGDPIDGAVEGAFRCHACTDRPPAFLRARSAARYRDTLARAMQAFKYNSRTCLAPDLADLLEGCYRVHYPDCRVDAIVPVPLYPRKERERTYNQSALLARELGRRLKRPVLLRALLRTRHTDTQTTLSAAKRRINVDGAFVVQPRERDWLAGKTCLLVDDVMTTGATVDACAAALTSAGVWRVLVLTVGRG